jgi:Ring finger domain
MDPGPESYMCNICCEEFTSKKVVLACNPSHIFCYDCILDWYKKNSGVVSTSYNGKSEYEDRKCPICRKDGGFLKIPSEIGNQNKLPGIHIEKAIIQKSSYQGKCDCINYNSYDVEFPCSSSVYYSILCFDGEYKSKMINICWHHYHVARKAGQLKLADGSGSIQKPLYTVFQRIPCQIKTGTGSQCSGNCNMTKNGILQSIMVGNYGEAYVCTKHKTDYDEKGKTLALFGAGSDHPLRSFSKKGGISSSDGGMSSTATITTTTPVEIPEGACGEKLKNGGYCKRPGKSVYCGKCAAHKPSSSLSLSVSGSNLGGVKVPVPVTEAPKIDINKFVNTWNTLHSTLSTLKETVDNAVFDAQIEKLEQSLSRIHQHISSLKYNAYEENAILCEEIEIECTLFCSLLNGYKKVSDDPDHQKAKVLETSEVSQPKAPEVPAKSGTRKTRYVLVDLFNLRSSSYCNVRLENGKLCGMPGNKYSSMKCSRHHQEHYNKEFFRDPKTDMFVRDLSPEELEKILEKPGKP